MSRTPISPRPNSNPRVPPSSAAFLQHLHSDPSSHHITLSGHRVSGLSLSPQSLTGEGDLLDINGTSEPSISPSLHSHLSPVSSGTSSGPSPLGSVGRAPSKRARPKTAPSRNDEWPLGRSYETSPDLPPLIPPQADEHLRSSPVGDLCTNAMTMDEGLVDAMEALSTSGEPKSYLIGRSESLAGTAESHTGPSKPSPASMNWSTFAQAYAHGLFDPNRVPNPPTPNETPTEFQSARSSPGQKYSSLPLNHKYSMPTVPHNRSGSSSENYSSKSSKDSVSTNASSAPSTSSASASGKQMSMAASLAARKKAYELENIRSKPSGLALNTDKLSLPSYSLAAATVRMASTSILNDLAPLSMPSPERELTDPLASVVSFDSSSTKKDSARSDPGSSRFPLHHSVSSAANPYTSSLRLPTIQASPVTTPLEGPHRPKGKDRSPPRARHGIVNSRIPSASAPLEKTAEAESSTDYFGAVAVAAVSPQETDSSSTATDPTPTGPSLELRKTTPLRSNSVVPEPSPRQQKDPLPPLVTPSDLNRIYDQYGWLPAPLPPDEAARRRALYRFSILHSAPDINFNRIAHMTKLVFNPKAVLITLIDSDTQWFKSQSGFTVEQGGRISSFCAHTILPRTDEPFVVLDTSSDWRFENNPNVVGPNSIRFYAGAPLRTADGFNVGALCILDDKPRTEFPPRSRLILKEFAAVTMREMELWRDKLQLRVRDKIQTSMEKFTRECLEMDSASPTSDAETVNKMEHVYSRAAQLVCSTIGLDGCFILDISQIEMVQTNTPTGKKSTYRANPYGAAENTSPVLERSESFGPVNPFPVLAAVPTAKSTRALTPYEHEKLSDFMQNHHDGRIFEGAAPQWIRYMFPQSFRYGMAVPIYGVDQQPFAMICAYTANPEKQFLEGYELQFLRAIGVIILSAVLRRRMALADKTKSILISSVSHELRTPLHGILAAAELLSDTQLDSNQLSFLKTVQTCGNSLIETVNHVLDFTKLSGTQSCKGSPSDLGKVNLAALVEQTVEGCWIGQRARFFMGDSDIGSFYAPPAPTSIVPKSKRALVGEELSHVETVVDIDMREKGWMVRCEKGGLRRVLMNLVGNSFKFTKNGYIQVSLREMPHEPGSKTIPVEMTVVDTGKGIGKDFLKDQLFHPFSQENPLQTGTGLGLAIVNTIVRSDSVNGKVDVWSAEGVGTEIKVTFDVEVVDDDDGQPSISSSSSVVSATSTFGHGLSVSFVGFNPKHQGHMLSCEVFTRYVNYWYFSIEDQQRADILIVNELEELVNHPMAAQKPILLLSVQRGFESTALAEKINRGGGFCQVVYKPVGPSALQKALNAAVHWIEERDSSDKSDILGGNVTGINLEGNSYRPSISRGSSGESHESHSTISELSNARFNQQSSINSRLPLQRRRSEENEQAPRRPSMAPRGMTYHSSRKMQRSSNDSAGSTPSQVPPSPTSSIPTIPLADGGVMLKAATVSAEAPRKEKMGRVMVVEDNVINRRVLGAFLKKRGFEYAEAVDGQAGVELFENAPPNYWDVILMDISMPIMNGHQATRAIRRIEATRRNSLSDIPIVPPPGKPVTISSQKAVQARVKIFALTGLATPDDKREAFWSGVDGYLVKPVSLSSLDIIFKKIGF
ncbi:two-component sensor molecule, putative [Cryptococcus deneoformans JEC21]|uniref:histidine kinase n=2 Tax=Cryptococcus neoformans species complex TaxID=1897064 RepID=Q5KPB6_CRYD1|nr:two-component sensor molecule, putative [Cryptococcus neoformans var. neoformans JEC21]AAW40853.2 two-component sensor molecule, putative [Cryptococcus neoformans var. neoformans JEC21]BAF47081.1 CnHHK5 [Cryptococcus neoformans var. neoformans]